MSSFQRHSWLPVSLLLLVQELLAQETGNRKELVRAFYSA